MSKLREERQKKLNKIHPQNATATAGYQYPPQQNFQMQSNLGTANQSKRGHTGLRSSSVAMPNHYNANFQQQFF